MINSNAANKLAEQWLKDAQIEAEFSPDQSARLEVAISFAQGNCHNLWFNRMDDRWYAPLAETVRFFLAHKKHFDIAQRIFDNRLAASDEGDRLRGDYLKLLQTEVDSLTPQQVATLVSWSLSGRMELSEPIDGRTQLDASEIPTAIWKSIAQEHPPALEQDDRKNRQALARRCAAIDLFQSFQRYRATAVFT